jgi:hypothetical protein
LLQDRIMETRRSSPRRGPWTETTRTLIECLRCREVCEDTVTHALRVGGPALEDERIGALLDCADVCRTTATLIRRGSPLAGRTAGIAADLCERAAEACAAFAEDRALAACAETCRRCAAWCRRLATQDAERAA